MNIGILGTGNVGTALGSRWAQVGHAITFGSRDPQSEKVQTLLQECPGAQAAGHQAAVDRAEIVVLATPWRVTAELLGALSGWDGKILIDATNPIAPGLTLAVGLDSSAAEQVAVWAPGAQVVKAFNTTGYNVMRDPLFDGISASMFFCGDDPQAKAACRGLIEALGFDPIDCGALAMARYLEPMALMWINLTRTPGLSREIAFKLLRR
ncbi:MAG: NADPH-dependent F420 reductase [Anaerolineales bacterium]|jgi:predicted dinucleotide-binding enzyme